MTCIRCINFLEIPDSGKITISDFGSIDIKDGKLFKDGKYAIVYDKDGNRTDAIFDSVDRSEEHTSELQSLY